MTKRLNIAPKRNKVLISLRVDAEIHEKLRIIAAQEKVAVSRVVEFLLRAGTVRR